MRVSARTTVVFALVLAAAACTPPAEPALPEVHIENRVCPEGNAGTTNCALPIRLSAAATTDVVLTLALDAAGTSAMPDVDFAFTVDRVVIPAGATSADVEFLVIGDPAVEPDETIAITMTVVSGATPAAINGAGANLVISNDDAPPPLPSLRVENRLCVEGNPGRTTCPVMVRLSAPAAGAVTFRVGLEAASTTASPGTDFELPEGDSVIAEGGEAAEINLIVVGDHDVEPDETVGITVTILAGAVPAAVNGRGGVVTITNDDVAITSPLPLGGARFQHTATKLPDGRVFVAGGHDGAGEVATTLLISADGTRITPGPALPEARARHAATLLPDGRVLLTGGLGAGSPLALPSTALCDLTANRCTSGPVLSVGRLLHAAVMLGDQRVLLAGGVPNYGTPDKLTTAELFVPGSGGVADRVMAAENELPAASDSMAAALLPNGEVLLAGGAGAGTSVQLVRYHPGIGFSRDASSLNHGRVNATATLLADGRVMVAGGFLTRTVEMVSLGATPAGPLVVGIGPELAEARYHHVAVPLPDGRVMLTGGYTWDSATSTLSARSSVETFSPPLNGFTASAPLSTGRGEFAAALLGNGYVVHVGGSDGTVPSDTMDVLLP